MTNEEITRLGHKLDKEYRIFKQPWFGYIMPTVNKYHGDFALAEKTLRQHINGLLESWYERIIYEAQISARKSDIKKALLERLKEDFFKRGYRREQIALNELKRQAPGIIWAGDADEELENTGIDLIGTKPNGQKIGISVKGYAIKHLPELADHKEKLLKTADRYEVVSIIYVDEIKPQLDYERVK